MTENECVKRKRNRLEKYDYSSTGAYFFTLCTKDRRNCFWNHVGATRVRETNSVGRPQDVVLSPCGKIVDEAIQNISNVYSAITVDYYVIMPNHIHILLQIHGDEYGRPMVAPTLSRVVQQMKGYVTKRIGHSIWQKLFYDHVIRDRQDYEEHVRYIMENPARWYYDELYTEE